MLSEIEKPPSTDGDAEDDAERLEGRAGEVLPHLHPGVVDAFAEGAVEHVMGGGASLRRLRQLDQSVMDLDLALRHARRSRGRA